jgi:Dockerin type I domain
MGILDIPNSPMSLHTNREALRSCSVLPITLAADVRSIGCMAVARAFFFIIIGALLWPTQPSAQAIIFDVTLDSSTANAPSGFFTAFNNAIQFYETTFDDPITINLNVGWGEVAGQAIIPGFLGESSAIQPGFFHFGTIKTDLLNDAKSVSDLISIANLPATDPTNNATFKLSRSNSRALRIMPGNGAGLDGSVGFDTTAPYTFDTNHRAVAGKYDFIGLAEHEVSEVMGRYGLGQNGASSGIYSPLDFFRYASPGVLDLTPANGAYFSINGGTTAINTFNGTGGGDLSDWAGATYDSYNASLTAGVELDVSPGDITAMDVIGYDLLVPGDFNRDGHVNAADIPMMLQALADSKSFKTNNDLTDAAFTKLADLNGDGQATNADIQYMLNNLLAGDGSTAAVSEPASFVLLALILPVVITRACWPRTVAFDVLKLCRHEAHPFTAGGVSVVNRLVAADIGTKLCTGCGQRSLGFASAARPAAFGG